MSVTQRQIWADYVLNDISAKPGLFGNGIVQIDARPIFQKGEKRYRIPYLKDLKTIAGSNTDQRITNVDGMKLSTKRADGYDEEGPIVRRGDAIEDNWFEQARSGEDILAKYGPQVGPYWALCIEDVLFSLLRGFFGKPGTAGALAATHQHFGSNGADYGSAGPLEQKDIVNAKAAHTNADGGADGAGDKLVVAFVNPLVHADVVGRTSVVTSLADGTASSAFTTGKVNKLGNAILIEAPRMCVAFDATTGSKTEIEDAVYPTYLMGLNSLYLGYERAFQTFVDEVALVNGRQYLLSWLHSYVPHCYGMTYGTGATDNPANTDLETVGNWSRVGKVSDIDVRQIITRLS